MFGLIKKIAETAWDTSNIPIAVVRDIVTQEDDSMLEEKVDSIVNNLEDIFTGEWDDD